MRFPIAPFLGFVASSAAVRVYVSSYGGTVTSLQLTANVRKPYSLTQLDVDNVPGTFPSWLEKDEYNGVVWDLDEGWGAPNGSITTYQPSASGKLVTVGSPLTVIGGPVSSITYNGGRALAVAHYGGSSVTTYTILPSGNLKLLDAFTFQLTAPGANPARQEAPHPHEALLDPSGSFIVVPDLGADLVRIFKIDPITSHITENTPFVTPAGAGPRHGAFLKAGVNTYFFLVAELDNKVRSYKVIYGKDTLKLVEVFSAGMYGPTATPATAAAAEAIVSPDGKFLITSSRNAPLFNIDNFDPTNSTKIPSDTLQTWSIDPSNGKLCFVQLSPAGGSFPRQFSLNKRGTLAAVGLQMDSRVVIIERNVADGTFGKFVASINIAGQISSAIWDE